MRRYESGQPYTPLDPLYTYLRVTGGRNTGTNILQAAEILAERRRPTRG